MNTNETGMNRRSFVGAAAADDKTVQKGKLEMPPMHKEKKPEVGMLLWPGVMLLDLIGPQTVLDPGVPRIYWRHLGRRLKAVSNCSGLMPLRWL